MHDLHSCACVRTQNARLPRCFTVTLSVPPDMMAFTSSFTGMADDPKGASFRLLDYY
jgi:hypothetical protein